MNKCFIVRHAQTFYNSAKEECEKRGESLEYASFRWDLTLADSELSDIGIRQSEDAVALAHTLNVNKVFVSPLKRALQTCEILFRNHPLQPSIIVYPELHEVLHNGHDVSSYIGEPFEEYKHFDWSLVEKDILAKRFIDQKYRNILDGIGFQEARIILLEKMKEINPEYLESEEHVFQRSQNTKSIWKEELNSSNIALVTHSSFLKQFTKRNIEENGLWLQNCEIQEYFID